MKNKLLHISIALSVGCLAPGSAALAADIDFEGLQPGSVVDQVSEGAGVSGSLNGFVGVFGFNPLFGVGTNAAIVFDSSCAPGGIPQDCTGGDFDLGTPNEDFGGPGVGIGGEFGSPFANDVAFFNILIVAEKLVDGNGDGLVDDPDDADLADQFIEFDFSSVKGGKSVTVNSITYVDNEAGEFNAQLELFGPGTLNPSVIGFTPVGDNGVNTLTPGLEGVTHLRAVLAGSGAIEGITFNEEVERPCWVTTGGFDKGEVQRMDSSGQKICTFGGNVGPPPSGAFEVNWHNTGDPLLDGSRFHTNAITAVRCEDRSDTGPGQPGGKKGLVDDTLVFECDGKFNNQSGFTCTGFLLDGGEPGGKKGNDEDQIQLIVSDAGGVEVGRCEGILSGGNVQIHPAVGKP